MPRALSFVEFAIETGGVSDAEVDGHLHAGLRAAGQPKTYHRWAARRLAELQEARSATRAAYHAAIDRGEIREPSEDERLAQKAAGHPDNASTAAAQRLLAKKAGRALQRQSEPPAK